MPLVAGLRLGVYEIVSPLGAGGMGEVWKARDTTLNRDVALKVLPAPFSQDPERLARFKREAQVLASLNHPNIAIVHGFEQADGINALVMELVDGPTLADRIAQERLPVEEAIPIARQLVDALEAAHEHGIIHRDLKPANISLRPDGTVKVLDFGLAKAVHENPSNAASVSMSPTLTSPAMSQAGVIVGTAAYMSPEQARGKLVDKRADIWAFGCVLFEMLTGSRVFEGEDVSLTLAEVMKSEPNWNALPPDVPSPVRSVLKSCLQKDPKRRVRDIGDVRLAIDGEFDATPQGPQPTSRPAQSMGRKALPWAAGLLTGAAVAGVVSLRPSAPTATITRFPITLADGQTFTGTGRHSLAISPDGTKIAYVANARLYIRSMGDLEARPVSGAQGQPLLTTPVFSPDGLAIAFYADNALKKIGVNGGAAVTLCQATNPFGMSWSADGIVFGQNPGGIMRVSSSGGTPEVLVPAKGGEIAHGPQLLAKGKIVLFTVTTGLGIDQWNQGQIVVQSLESGERRLLIDGGNDARYLRTGHIIYAVGGVLFAVRFDPARLATSGGATPVIEGVRRASGNTGAAHFSVSDSGTLIFIPGPVSSTTGQRDLAYVDRGGTVTRLKLPPASYEFPRLSPDGTQVAFGLDDGKEAATVWVYNLSGTASMRRLTFGGASRFPVWSQDGKRVTFQSDREGDRGIFWQRADGNGPVERLTKPQQGTSHAPESWSPNGETLMFSATNDSGVFLWTVSLRDKKVESFGGIQSSESMDPAFSPDGRWVAYDSVEAGRPNVYVEPFPHNGTRYQLTKDEGNVPFWAPDGTRLYFVPSGGQLAVAAVTTQPSFVFGNPVSVARGDLIVPQGRASRRNFDLAPDGQRIYGVVDAFTTSDSGTAIAPTIQVVLNWLEELKQRVPGQ